MTAIPSVGAISGAGNGTGRLGLIPPVRSMPIGEVYAI